MGHEAAHERKWLALGQARWSEIDGFVEAVATARPHRGKAGVVLPRAVRINHGRKPRGIGGDDQVLGQAPLQAEPRNTEVRILVGQLDVPRVIR